MSSSDSLRVLFVDDEGPIRDVMANELPRMGHEVTICADGASAISAVDKATFDAAIVDLRMPGVSGWDVIEHIKGVAPETEVIISTGHGGLDDAIRAIRQGAYDFLLKPSKLAAIANVLKRISEKRALSNRALALESQLKAVQGTTSLIGETSVMRRVKLLVERVGPTDSTVLILGETGTGKELVAQEVHSQSQRAGKPFVPVNCGALPENLVESELFGHGKGAFTGAEKARKGLIEVANGGTLFLDELGELDKSMQVKLLRFLESGEVRRVGENEPFQVDVRVVCATNRGLEEMVAAGTFRQDLFFRVNTFEINLPPLRERQGDIPSLAAHLAARILKRPKISPEMLTAELLEALSKHTWPGNVRELANALEHAVILAGGQPMTADHLPSSVLNSSPVESVGMNFTPPTQAMTLREIEMNVIESVLDKHDGDKPKTAKELGIALKTLYNKINQNQSRAAG
ncbi:Transcriptional regulatory protein ZraR [Symmachiella dynata]|uniref:Transcriptional regulatory protein ZraR n=1 Tax=Symmachiella dynata TaxID=2527995 RepID=A0A517ZNL2_9PLAN|nr:sigma-54 dependent transcriptional regulator [Symmachiella dynata]QDU44073.1 Transcriptional regulatory protein ZraR [Symmachiella dynata]